MAGPGEAGGTAPVPDADLDVEDQAAVRAFYTELQNWKLNEAADRDTMKATRGETAMEGKDGSQLVGKFEY